MKKILMVGLVVMLLMAGAVTASASSPLEPVEGRTFPAGTLVIPMDDHQSERIEAFGFVHALLRQGITIFRILQSDTDPADFLMTVEQTTGADYYGGPILVEEEIPAAITAEFPTVTVHTLTEEYISDRVFRAGAPTEILVIHGLYGHTQDVLDWMKIPYDMVFMVDVEADPGMLADYNLVVVDCPGWWLLPPPDAVAEAIERFVADGGEAIFTDIALSNLVAVFPGYVTVTNNYGGTWDFDVHNVGEFPSQYHGPSPLPIYTMGGGFIADEVLDPEVRVILDIQDYAGTYKIGAFYFPYGDGVVEGFAYHPGDQEDVGPESMILSAALYGNKFIHVLPEVVECVDLIAGQHIVAGQVCVNNDGENLYITYTTADGWILAETHLAVSTDEPGTGKWMGEGWQNRPGNPRPGRFPHKAEHDTAVDDTYTYTIPLVEITDGVGAGDTVFVAAQAVVVHETEGIESAWGNGERFVERGDWAMYFGYTVR